MRAIRLSGIGVTLLMSLPALLTTWMVSPCHGESGGRHQVEELLRAGRFEESLRLLESLRRSDPSLEVGDLWILALHGAGRHREVLVQAEGLPEGTRRPEVRECVAGSLRRVGRLQEAAQLYQAITQELPLRWQSRLGLALCRADAGQPDEASRQIERLLEEQPREPELLMGAAYIERARGEFLRADRRIANLLELQPDRPEAHRLRILTAADLGATQRALELADERPAVLGPEDWHRLRGDRAAQLVKWGDFGHPDHQRRYERTDHALALLESNLAALPESVGSARRRAWFDRLVALRDRSRVTDVIREYERLTAEGIELPYYALNAAGDAYLHAEQPERAESIYRAALQQVPGDHELRIALFYALIETHQYRAALEHIDAHAAEQPVWNTVRGQEHLIENPEKVEAETTAAMGRAYCDRLHKAWVRLYRMGCVAPQDGELRQARATVELWRGWPRHALAEYEIASSSEPNLLSARIGRAYALLDLARYPAAFAEIEALSALIPENKWVQQLQCIGEMERRWELTVEATHGESQAEAGDVPETGVEAFLYAPPVRLRFRPYVTYRSHGSRYEEGRFRHDRIGLGLLFRGVDGWVLNGELHQGIEGDDRLGLAIWMDGGLSDHWEWTASYDSLSQETPLRALEDEIRGWKAGLGATYRASELTRVEAAGDVLRLNDGNERRSGRLEAEQRIFTGFRYRLNAIGELYASTNTRRDAPYYNPESDRSLGISMVNDWEAKRRYEHAMVHRLVLHAGHYWQEGYGGKPVYTARYEHDWMISLAYDLRYGVGWSDRVFDGQREQGWWAYVTTDWRF